MVKTIVKYVENPKSDNLKIIEAEISQEKNIFQAFEEKQLSLPHGCLAGSCGSCAIEILEGEQYLSEPGTIEKNTIESIQKSHRPEFPIRLSCRAKARGPVVFRALVRVRQGSS